MARAGWLFFALLAGCSPAAPPATPADAPAPAPTASAAATDAPVEVGGPGPTPLPVAAPAGLLLDARSRPLSATARELGRIAGLPLDTLLGLLGPGALRTDAGLGAAVMLDPQSEDIPGLMAAFSVPVTSDGAFLKAMERARWSSRGVGYAAPSGPLAGLFCKTVVSLGDAPLRAVCGSSERDVNFVGPYLCRGLPSVDMGPGDLRVRLHFSSLKERVSPSLSELQKESGSLASTGALLMGVLGEPDILAAPGAIVDEAGLFMDALDGASFGVTIDGEKKRVSLDGKVRFARNNSWMVRLLSSKSERGPAPEFFWLLPRDSPTALYGRGVDATLLEGPRRVTRNLIGFALKQGGISDADRRAVDEALAAFPRGDAAWVLAGDSPPAGKDAALGWWLLGTEGSSSAHATWLRKSGQAVQRAISLASRSGAPGVRDAAPAARIEENPAGFPSGSTLLELSARLDLSQLSLGLSLPSIPGMPAIPGLSSLSSPPAASGSGGATRVTVVAVAVPDGKGHSWLALGSDRATLKTRVKQALARSPADAQLSSNHELAPLRSEASGFGGMMVLGPSLERAGKPGSLRSAPNGFKTPLLLQGGADPSGVTVKAIVQEGTLQDLAALISAGAGG